MLSERGMILKGKMRFKIFSCVIDIIVREVEDDFNIFYFGI